MSLDRNQYKVRFFDVSNNPILAKEVKMFGPTLFIFNDIFRYNGPITIDTIKEIEKGIYPKRKPYQVHMSNHLYMGSIEFLTPQTVQSVSSCCSFKCDQYYTIKKGFWIQRLQEKYHLPHLGTLHLVKDKCLGGAEFVPSLAVPYDIPKSSTDAFLTCSYHSSEVFDYRSYPLQLLEHELKDMGYKHLLAIASEEVYFPNGTLDWFINRGYEDCGLLYDEMNDYAKMHLIRKKL